MIYPAPKISMTLSLVMYAIALPFVMLGGLFPPLLFIGIPVAIASCVFGCILLHRCWAAIPERQRRTTPGKAVGFMFIPFYNFYWVFVAYAGLATDLAKATRTKDATGLGITLGILWIVCWIPIFGLIAQIAYFVIWILFTRQVVHQANMLLAVDHDRTSGRRNGPTIIEMA